MSEPKFVQIAAAGSDGQSDGLYALDEDGRAWVFWDKVPGSPGVGIPGRPAAWHKLSNRRVADD